MADNPLTEIEVADNSSPTLATSALQTTLNTRVGDLTETAPGTDTASSGLNGRLQRIAQRLTSIFTAQSDGTQQTKIRGNTDGTLIGNVADALKVIQVPTLKTFVACAHGITIGNNKSMISIVNASGSAVKVKIRELWIKNVQTAGVTGIVAQFQMNSIVDHSAGTAITPKPYDSTDTLDSSVTSRTGGTVTSEGTSWRRWYWSSDEWGPGPADTETTEHAFQNLNPHYQDLGGYKTITLNANEGLHVKQVTNSAVGTFDLELVFTVE